MAAFLHPGLLVLLPLAAIPLLLHLLTLHQLKTVELSTYRFLFDSYVQQRRRMRFLEALLAILRVLFVLAMVLVVARPVVRHWDALFGKGGPAGEVILLVDSSASMNASSGETSMKRAQNIARAVLQGLRPDDRLTLVRVSSQPQELCSRFAADRDELQEQIDQLRAGPSRANFLAALQLVFGPQAPKRAKPTVYILTDAQAAGWREVRDQSLGNLIPADARLKIVNVGSSQPLDNRAVIGSSPRERRAIVGLPVVLRPRVANYSPSQAMEVPVSVVIDQKEVARTTLSLKAGESGGRELVYVPREPGVLHGRFEIAADQFPDDDSFLFTLSVAPAVKVLLVNGLPAADPFENETIYLRAALSATGDDTASLSAPGGASTQGAASRPGTASPGANLLPSQEFLKSLEVVDIPEGQLNQESLRDARVVVLANCGALHEQQFHWLRQYVKRGGGLLVLPGDKVAPATYNDLFFRNAKTQEAPLIPLRLSGPLVAKTEASFYRLGTLDFAHPALAVFSDPDSRYFSTVYLSQRFELSVPEGTGNVWRVAEFTEGGPALVESRYGDGAVMVAAFPASAKWGNLPLKPEFVPLMLRLASHLEHRPELDVPGVVPADSPVEISIAENWAPATGKVSDSAGRFEPLAFTRDGGRFSGAYEKTTDKGFYTVQVMSAAKNEVKGTAAFAVNLSSDESKFDMADEVQFRSWLPNTALEFFDASAETQQLFGRVGDQPNEVWGPIIFIMFFIIAAEFLLATLGGGRADGEEPLTVMQRLRRLSPGSWAGQMTGAREKAVAEEG